jgi:hypothetical protein
MPWAECPACKTDVKYPRDSAPGTKVACPDCDEVFVPPELRANPARKGKKAYNPEEDEEVCRVERPIDDADRGRKAKRVAAAVHHAKRQAEEAAREPRRPFFGGPETVLLGLAVAFAVVLPIAFGLAKRFPSKAETGVVVFIYAGVMLVFFVKLMRAKSQLGGK